jgi:hypothetical protein
MDRVQTLLGHSDAEREANYVGYRVIADHGRAATFLIGDGVRPGATGAGYVLRMIIRRAARFGRNIGFTDPFLVEVAEAYIDHMGDVYPELRQRRELIVRTLRQEEERFARTLDSAVAQLDEILAGCNKRARRKLTATPPSTCMPPTAYPWKLRGTSPRSRALPSMRRALRRRVRPTPWPAARALLASTKPAATPTPTSSTS